ncbi:MAG: hypothetical protein OIF47_12660 [Marinibacterium sp.]|nr:hypothetical protein [Marinibacterium sp.]
MSGGQTPPVFLERRTYRRRRVLDAARVLPWIGSALLAAPMLWPVARPDTDGATMPMSHAMTFVFAAWFGLILLSAVLSVLLGRTGATDLSDAGDVAQISPVRPDRGRAR